jgi:hypothetical protein
MAYTLIATFLIVFSVCQSVSLQDPDSMLDMHPELSALNLRNALDFMKIQHNLPALKRRSQELVLQNSNATLTALRMANARTWILRALAKDTMINAYNTVVNFSTIFHIVRGVGNFGPGIVALEYDYLAVGLGDILGYSPVVFTSYVYDPSTTAWITPDVLLVDYTQSLLTGFDTTTFKYLYNESGFRLQEYIQFDPNSALINTGYTINDPGALKMFELTQASLTPAQICGIAWQACNPANSTSYWADTGFTDIVDCITFMTILQATPSVCPYPDRSNTTSCRGLHAFGALFLPSVHCAHVKRDSVVCKEQCLPACANCDPKATCVPTFPNFPYTPASFNAVYKCQCPNGYVGDGLTCAPQPCSSGSICPSRFGTYTCSNTTGNLCQCNPSWTPQPSVPTSNNSLCVCPAPSVAYWYNSSYICLTQGRCISDTARYMCSQPNNVVKCVLQQNDFNPLGLCQCNYGYNGGIEYPCTCATGRRQIWSDALDGKVCLNATECTEQDDCGRSQTCVIPTGSQIGVCVAGRKRDMLE